MAARQRGPDPEHRARLAQLDDRAGRVAAPDGRGGLRPRRQGTVERTTSTTTSCRTASRRTPTFSSRPTTGSRCATGIGWSRTTHQRQALPAAARHVRAARTAQMRVVATVDSARRTSIFEVEPGRTTPQSATPGTPYRIESRDSTGAVIASVAPTTTVLHVDGQDPGLVLEATLPFTSSTAAVVVSGGGAELARRTRSPHAPAVKLLRPRPGARLTQRHSHARQVAGARRRRRSADRDCRLLGRRRPPLASCGRPGEGQLGARPEPPAQRFAQRETPSSGQRRVQRRGDDLGSAARRRRGAARPDHPHGPGQSRSRRNHAAPEGSGVRRRRSPAHRGPPQVVRRQAAARAGELLTVMSLSPKVKSIRLVATDAATVHRRRCLHSR